jgi:hypothetical protein
MRLRENIYRGTKFFTSGNREIAILKRPPHGNSDRVAKRRYRCREHVDSLPTASGLPLGPNMRMRLFGDVAVAFPIFEPNRRLDAVASTALAGVGNHGAGSQSSVAPKAGFGRGMPLHQVSEAPRHSPHRGRPSILSASSVVIISVIGSTAEGRKPWRS